MHLDGSCHCGAVRFSLKAAHPVPFNRCYCSICRKTAGGGGFAINIGGRAETLEVSGRDHIGVYRAVLRNEAGETVGTSEAERRFCTQCGSALWAWDPRWPDLIHPHASAIDTDLPIPPERVHLMLGSRASWVEPDVAEGDKCFTEYPDESLEAWHKRTGMEA